MKAIGSKGARSVVVRGEPGDFLPDSLLRIIASEGGGTAFFRGTGILAEVALRAYDAGSKGPAESRHFAGPIQALVIDGTMTDRRGDFASTLTCVLSRQTESGIETVSGELVSARVVGLDGCLTILADVALGREIDRQAGVVVLVEPRGDVLFRRRVGPALLGRQE